MSLDSLDFAGIVGCCDDDPTSDGAKSMSAVSGAGGTALPHLSVLACNTTNASAPAALPAGALLLSTAGAPCPVKEKSGRICGKVLRSHEAFRACFMAHKKITEVGECRRGCGEMFYNSTAANRERHEAVCGGAEEGGEGAEEGEGEEGHHLRRRRRGQRVGARAALVGGRRRRRLAVQVSRRLRR